MALSLANKHAIVPGGSRGIGLAIAQELARRGASVLITYVSSPSRAETAVAEIKKCAVAGAKVSSIKADSADSAAAADLVVEGAHDLFETIDIIINNAADGSDVSLEQVTTENFDHLFHANLLFPLLLCKASKKYLRQGARIVNISSTSARRPYPTALTYAASKAGLESITKTLAFEFGREFQATVNAVNPGPVRTDMWNESEEIEKFIKSMTPAGERIATPEDIADIVAMLCEEKARWITGSTTCANGGYLPT